jgi:hypothetical protein
MEFLTPPKPFVFGGNVRENFKRWRKAFEVFLKASGGDKKDEDTQVAVLLHCIGEESVQVVETLEVAQNVKDILEGLERHYSPQVNECVSRHTFFTRDQKEGESFDQFCTELRIIAKDCEFGTIKDSLIRDRIICGIRDVRLKDRLLRESNLDLNKTVQICKAAELAGVQLKTIQNDPDSCQVLSVKKPVSFINDCKFCGQSHKVRQCPAYGQRCTICKRLNHFAKVCRVKKRVYSVEEENVNKDSERVESLFLGVINNKVKLDWYEKLKVVSDGRCCELNVKLDTGAQANVIPKVKLEELKMLDVIKPSNAKLSNYSGSKIPVVGKCQLQCWSSHNVMMDVEFQVVKTNGRSPVVLGLPTINKYGLLKRVDVLQHEDDYNNLFVDYNDLFEGVGKLDYEYNIKLKHDAVPHVDSCRKVPFKLREPLLF